jgi:hypothetical protein
MKRSLIILLLLSKFSFGQINDSNSVHKLSIFGGVLINNHINGGLFYKGDNFLNKNDLYSQVLYSPNLSFSLGVEYKKIFQLLDFSFLKRRGPYPYDIGSSNINVKYFGYQTWYDFLKMFKFPVKPLISFKLSYIEKKYNLTAAYNTYGSNWAMTKNYNDISKVLMVQLPLGLYFDYKFLFVSFSYDLNVFEWIKGSYRDEEQYHIFTNYSNTTSENYSGNSTNSDYQKQKNMFSFRFGYSLKF